MTGGSPLICAYFFCLDLVYLHMDLNTKVPLVSSVPSIFNPINRSTSRGCSFHGIDIMFNTSKMLSSTSAVTKGRRLTGIGLKVKSAAVH